MATGKKKLSINHVLLKTKTRLKNIEEKQRRPWKNDRRWKRTELVQLKSNDNKERHRCSGEDAPANGLRGRKKRHKVSTGGPLRFVASWFH